MCTEVFRGWDSKIVGIYEKNTVSSYGSEYTVNWWSLKSCATMTEPKQDPILGITIRRDSRLPVLDFKHCRGKRYRLLGDRV